MATTAESSRKVDSPRLLELDPGELGDAAAQKLTTRYPWSGGDHRLHRRSDLPKSIAIHVQAPSKVGRPTTNTCAGERNRIGRRFPELTSLACSFTGRSHPKQHVQKKSTTPQRAPRALRTPALKGRQACASHGARGSNTPSSCAASRAPEGLQDAIGERMQGRSLALPGMSASRYLPAPRACPEFEHVWPKIAKT